MENTYQKEERYLLAQKKVKKIKGFYIHLLVYILVNSFILIVNTSESLSGNKVFWSWNTFSTALFWGIGLMAHGLSVFSRNIFFGSQWEERKIREFMEKGKTEKWE